MLSDHSLGLKYKTSNVGPILTNIQVVDHNPLWADAFEQFKEELQADLTDAGISKSYYAIKHIGSTSLPIKAKPILDVGLILKNENQYNTIACPRLKRTELDFNVNLNYGNIRYIKDSEHDNEPKVYANVHKSGENCYWIRDKVLFKHFLLDNPTYMNEYEKLKMKIVEDNFAVNSREYCAEKHMFVENVMTEARKYYDCDTMFEFGAIIN